MLRFLVELAIAIGASLGVMTIVGWQHYVIVGGLFSIAILALIYATQGFAHNRDSAPTPIWAVMTIAISVALGAAWPAVPLIFAYERTKRRPAKPVNVVDGNTINKDKP